MLQLCRMQAKPSTRGPPTISLPETSVRVRTKSSPPRRRGGARGRGRRRFGDGRPLAVVVVQDKDGGHEGEQQDEGDEAAGRRAWTHVIGVTDDRIVRDDRRHFGPMWACALSHFVSVTSTTVLRPALPRQAAPGGSGAP